VASRLPTRGQVELADCGPAALAIVLEHFGRYVSLDELHEACGSGRDGVNALTLVQVAEHYGLRARGVKSELDDLRDLPAGTVLFWSLNHFVVLERTGRRGVTIVDPAIGRRTVGWAEADREYSGTALLFEPGDRFSTARRRTGQGLVGYLRPLLAQRAILGQVVGTSLVLRALGLALPLLTAIVIDRVLPVNGRSLLWPVAAAVATMVVAAFAATWLRARLLLEARVQVDLRTTLSFLEHLVALPLTFHQRREAGDLVMRLRSTSVIRETLTSGVLSAVLDGGFAILYLGLLLLASPALTITAIVLATVQVSVVALTQRTVQRLASESLRVEARSQSYAFQLLAGMSTLKASGTEARAVEEFTNRFVEELRAVTRRGKVSALLESLLAVTGQAGPLVLLGISAVQVLDGRLPLGAALAANALAAGFLTPLSSLVATGSSLVLVRSYVERLDDVFEAQREQEGEDVVPAPALRGNVRAVDLSFRYSDTAPLVVANVDLEVEPGKVLAVVGPSGSGKTTLAHLLLGLYPPTTGHVAFDGLDVSGLEAKSVRRQLGVVTQEPYLFATSIRDNIAFGRPDATLDDVQLAAELACIHDDIAALPLGYDTVLGEGGGTVSGGQRQRIAIARALCSRPRILLLDEATSHLDVITEARVHKALGDLGCTRIVVAHRLSTVAAADEIVVLDRGRLVERGNHLQLVAQGGLYAALVAQQDGGVPRARRRPRQVRVPRTAKDED
jgi:ATP-binding cassette subfamily B protein